MMQSLLFIVGAIVGLSFCLHRMSVQSPRLPDLPWLYRDRRKWFSKWRARVQVSLDYRTAVHEAYRLVFASQAILVDVHSLLQYSKNSQSCILPAPSKDIILLPPDAINWIASQSDSTLRFVDAARDALQTDHTMLVPDIIKNPTHHDTIRVELTRRLGSLSEDLIDELDVAFRDLWGNDVEHWKEVCLYETMIKIVARASNRVFVGKPLCRNDRLLKPAIGFAQTMPLAAAVLRMLPDWLRTCLAPMICYLPHKNERQYRKVLIPTVLQRLQAVSAVDVRKPNDFLQWTIDRALQSGSAFETKPSTIAARLLAVNFAAIHTSTITITNAVFDLVASEESNMHIIREEVQDGLAASGGIWSKQTIQRLVKLDSALRESSRIGTFLGVGLARLVTTPQGLTAPDGTECPPKSWIAVAANAIHFDPTNYDDVNSYKPFRFSDLKAATDSRNGNGRTTEDLIEKANLSFTTTSTTFQSFGHGRHACPGRFFAANELRLLLSYMVLHYDLEPLSTRPPLQWFGDAVLPPLKATVKVRRRKEALA